MDIDATMNFSGSSGRGPLDPNSIRIPDPMRRSFLIMFAAGLAWVHQATAQVGGPMAPGVAVAGVTQVEWAERWWQWAFSFERPRSPIADRTGQFCASRQSGDVWFLAGTYGTRRTERTCRVPRGKYLFFPIINYVEFVPEGSAETCASLVARAAADTGSPSTLILEVDGTRFGKSRIHRLASRGCFSLIPGGPPDASSNGYYVMLAPLTPGTHLIEFAGVLPTMMQAVTYRLVVE